MPYVSPTYRMFRISWDPYPGADNYQVEYKGIFQSLFNPPVETTGLQVTVGPALAPVLVDVRVSARAGGVVLAAVQKQISLTATPLMPVEPLLWFSTVDRSGASLTWDNTVPEVPALVEWRERKHTAGDPAGPAWTAPYASAPDLTAGNAVYWGTGFPGIRFWNSTSDSAVLNCWMELANPVPALDVPCTVLFAADMLDTSFSGVPRCLLQLGKLALYSATGAGENIGLRVDGGFLDSSLQFSPVTAVIAVVARSYDDIDIHQIDPSVNYWDSDLGLSGAAWENHGEFSLGGKLAVPYHAARFITPGFAVWDSALSLLDLKKAFAVLVNENNLQSTD